MVANHSQCGEVFLFSRHFSLKKTFSFIILFLLGSQFIYGLLLSDGKT